MKPARSEPSELERETKEARAFLLHLEWLEERLPELRDNAYHQRLIGGAATRLDCLVAELRRETRKEERRSS